MRIYAFAILLIAVESCSFFNGCDKDNDLVTLSDETRQWTPYSELKDVIFENESAETVVKVLEYTESVESFDRGDECSPGTKEVVLAKLLSTEFADTIQVRLTRQHVDLENARFQMTYFEDTKTVYPANDINKKYQETLMINQKVFNDVLISKCSACNGLSEIVFSKSNGLVAFRLNNVYWTTK